MPNSAAVIGTPTVSTVTEDTNNLQTLVAAGTISISDANAGQAAFKTTVIAASGDLGTLTIAASGAYTYSVADSKVQYLGAGDTKVDTFTVTSLDGTTKQVSFTIIGVNDTAVIGAPTVVDVTEDATSPTLKASGSISISDADQNQAAFKTTVISASGDLGTLVLQSNGSYAYSVADSAVQFLGAGDTKVDTFTVTSLDGTQKQISFTIHGTNDAAVIGTPTVHDVTEDATNPTLTAVGSISITDADQGQAAFKTTVISAAGDLGSLVLAANGTYTYLVADSAVQFLGAGQTKVDTFTVTSLDGTQKQISFTIHGVNDAAVIGTPTVHDVTEDATNPVIYAVGTVSITDADQGQAAFQPTLQAGNGNLGVLIMGSNGAYIYVVADSAVQYLGLGDTKIDTFTLTALDGTTKQVTFTIHGTNDAAVIGAPTVHDVTEDVNISTAGNLTASGTISISDADQNQSSFQTSVIAAAGTLGHLTIAANGAYSYTVADGAVQYLGAADSKAETFTVTALDGTTKQVTFTIHGANDAAVIGTPTVHDVTKNASPTTLTAAGTISISDVDQNQSSFQTSVIAAAGTLGHLTIAANGAYTYSVANSAVQYLGVADTKIDTFTVTSLDGTQKQVSFTIHGGSANTPAVIGDPTSATVTEDVGVSSTGNLTASGTIPITDPDAGQAAFQTSVVPGTGNLGALALLSTGAYTYSVADSAVQYLGLGDSKVDTFTIKSIDGTQKTVSFTIQGANDAAVIGDPLVHNVTEDANISSTGFLTAAGKLSISDVDQNQSSFQPGAVAGSGNLGTLTLAADGTYVYSVANSATQYLGATDTHIDTFTVHALDGTAKVISFTIQGVNDAAVIGDPLVHNVTENANVSPAGYLTAAGKLSITDVDQNQSSFQPGAVGGTGNLGSLTLAADGTYTYSVANSAVQYLGATETHIDTFTVTAFDNTQKTISFTIQGVNEAAVIGTPAFHDVTENANVSPAGYLTATGILGVTDVDQNQSSFQPGAVAAAGNLGTLTLAADGTYTYSVANLATQYLGAGQVQTDSFTVHSFDGTAQVVSFTVHGVNEAAVIGDPVIHNVTEDTNVTAGYLTAAGKLSISDVDQGQSSFQPGAVGGTGNLGSLTLAADGTYVYSVANSATQYLGATDTHIDTFTVTALDGTPKIISFTIQGVNDAATIGSPAVHDVTENANVSPTGYLTATGVLGVTDVDQNQSSFQPGAVAAPGNLGTLTLAADGTYTYSVANSATQYLGAGQVQTDSFTVHSFDGTAQVVSFTVHGVNEAAVIGTPLVHDVTEDANVSPTNALTASGQLSITDADQGQALFNTTVVPAAGNLGHLSLAADGTYTYSIDNAAVQHLAVGETLVETFTVSSVDGTTQPVSFTVHGTQDAPVLVASAASGTDDAPIPLSISTHLVDDFGSLSTVSISGIPATYTLNHGTVFDDGHWEVAASDLGTLALVPGSGANAGILTLQVSAASIEGGNHAVSTASMTVNVAPGAGETSARAVDGYIAGAFVFADANGNGVFDAGEASATTNADGSFTLHNAHGTLIMTGGTDISTGLAFAGTLKAPGGSTVVTPLTTLVTSVIASAALAGTPVTATDAAAQVATAFGIDPTHIDLTTYDPVPAAVSGDTAATAVLAAGVQVQSTVAQISAVGASSADVFGAIAGAITKAGTGGTVDLSTNTTVASIVSDSGVTGAAADAVTSVVSAANNSIQSATDVTQIAQAGQVAQGAATTDLAAAAASNFTDTTQVAALQQHYVTDLSAQVQNAVVASPAGPIEGTSGNDVLTGTDGIDTIDGQGGNDTIYGGAGADLLYGGAGNDRITGGAGNDHIDGGTGFDRAIYTDATGGITVNMAAGTASGAGVDSDTLVNIEGIVGSSFADTYDARGFTGNSFVPGTPIGYNEFEGGAGNDTVYGTVNALGAALTRVSYASATAGVTVDIAAGTADGDASVGHDTFVGPGIQSVWGSAHDDTLLGSNNPFGTVEVFAGFSGNDIINGRGGFDRADYNQDPTTTSGITVHLAAGIVNGDASVGTDTLISVEAVRGTNFADTYDATGFSGTSTNAGSLGTFNEFTGGGGNDTIIGNGNTRISFTNATAGVTVDIAAGTDSGDASVGTDTFTGVNAVQGSMFDDTLLGDANNNTFTGNGGNDFIDGRGGFDVASYNNIYLSTGSITVNMAAGIVTGDSSIGTDTLRSIEGIQGTGNADTYDATGYGTAGALNIGNNGSFNQFEGLGGNDTITGNGNTRVIYVNAAAGVTVDLSLGTAHGTAPGDLAAIGTDTITGGVNSITGSAFGDTLIGDGNSNTFTGGGGNDTIDGGGGGDIAIYSGARSQYTITTNAGVTTVVDNVAGRDGTDTLTNIEVLQFNNANVLINSGTSANPVDLSDPRLFFGAAANPLTTLTGSASDYVKINQALSGHLIDLGAGTDDTVILGITGGYNLNLANVEHLVGTGGNDFVSLVNNANGLSIDMGGGNDGVNLANGLNSVSVVNVENLNGSDFAAGSVSNDTLTLLNDVSGLSVNLGNGVNTLNLAAGANSFTNIFNVDTINGTASDDTLTVGNGLFTNNNDLSIDLGAGNDTLQVGTTFFNGALHNVEHLVGSASDDFYTLTNDQNGLTIDMGGGNDNVNLANGSNAVSVINVENLNGSDFAAGSVSNDTLTLLNDVSGLSVNLDNGVNTLNLAAGVNSLVNVFNVDTINGTASDDTLTVANGLFTPNNDLSIDLGAGNDTLQVGSTFFNGALHNVEHLVGSGGDDFYQLTNDQSGLTVDLGAGNNTLTLAGGVNSVSLFNVGNLNTGDWTGTPVDDAVTLLNDVSGLSVNLAQGNNTLTLAAGTNSLTAYNVQHINGSASDEVLTMLNDPGPVTIDLGAGNDTLNLSVSAGAVTVANVEHVNGSAAGDFITDASVLGTTTITGGGGADNITVGAATDIIRYTDASESSVATGEDTVNNFDATHDQFLLDNVAGLAGQIHFMASGVLTGTPATPHAEAILTNVGGQQQLQIDVNGDGVIGAGDITIVMNGLAGTLSDANFSVIIPNHAPTDIQLSHASVNENNPAGTLVGVLSDTDPDAGDTASYVLTNDAGGLFAISNGNLVTTGPLSYEQAASHTVTVQVTDSAGATFSKDIQIGVTDVNEAPTDVQLSNASVLENAPAGTAVGNMSAVNLDAGDTATYTLLDNAGGLFSMAASLLVTTAPLDYERAASHQITVRATDASGLTFDKTFTIATVNVNEAPTAILLSNSSVAENSPANAVVGALSAIDPDVGDTASFTLTNDAGGLFAISSGNLVTTAPLDYEQAASHQVTVRATDSGGLTYDATLTIATIDVNEAPTDISLSNAAVPQGAAVGTVVGALSAANLDAGDTATYTLVDNDGGQFAISGGNLVVAGTLTAGAQQIDVRATESSGLTFDKVIAISVNSGALVVGTAGPDTLVGTAGDDTIQGLAGNDRLQGLAGNDILDGGPGLDRAIYTDATSGITVNMAAGTVTGGSGSDTLINIEGVVGSDYADTYNATGFTGDTGIAGTSVGFNEFEGRGGNDTIISALNSQGAPLTRISYVSATAGVTVDLNAHTATGDASVGTDTLVGNGFGAVIGSAYADTLLGSNNASGTVEIFAGMAGNDTINGRGGFDRADYSQDPTTTSGITVNLAAGSVVGDATVGTDTLLSIESIRGTSFADSYNATGFSGASTNAGSNGTFNEFNGGGGNDTIVGNGNTRLAFVNATGGVTVDIAAGTDSGDASTGSDTFSGVNAIQASMFDDVLRGSNSTTTTETFAGLAGNDFIDGRGGFDISTYNNIYFSTGPVTVNMGAGTATGDASIGSDTLRSIEGIQGTNFNDVYDASTFGTAGALDVGSNGTFNQFEGLGGNDTITGNGNTRVIYSSATGGVTIHMAAGTATGDASVGTDSFTGVNSATGSQFADTYDATGFADTGAFNSGTFNLFEGLGGNDTITGNGNTRIAYSQAAAGVTVDLSLGTAHGTAGGDVAGVGTDTITGGVNSVQGSNSADTLIGGSGNETFFGGGGNDTISGGGGSDTISGQGGNDTIDGGAGTDMAVFTGAQAGYTISSPGAGQTQVLDHTTSRDGTDLLTNVEVLQFSDAFVLLTPGSAATPVDLSALNLFGNAGPIIGTAGDDYLTVGSNNVFGHQIDLGAGNDTVSLATADYYSLNLANVEHVVGTAGNDFVTLINDASGLSVDLGAGTDNLTLAGGVNSLSVSNVENLYTNDFTGPAIDDTVTLLNDVTGMSVNLAQGNNTLDLAAGSNSFVDLFNVQHVNGTASNDVLTVTDGVFTPDGNPVIDLGAGDNTLNFAGQNMSLTALNIEHINGSAADNWLTLNNDVTGVSIDLGAGNDHVSLANGVNSISVANVESISGSDYTGSSAPSDDTLTLLNDVSGVSVDLAAGSNTLNLAAGTNSLDNLFNINHLNGSTSDDVLTVTQQSFATVFDMGTGNDTINFGAQANGVTVVNAETVNGSTGNDFITVGNSEAPVTVTGGLGADNITAGSTPVNFNFNSAAESQYGNGDTIFNFDTSKDSFTFTNMTGANGFTGPVNFVDTAAFDGSVATPHSEARIDMTGGNATLQIDVNGDGVMDQHDIEIHLPNHTGTLHSSNFLLS
jgi:VCBS repeat-containing protein